MKGAIDDIENIQTGLLSGLEAMGNILSGYADNKTWGINPHDIRDFGWMMKTVAEILDTLLFTRGECESMLRESAAAGHVAKRGNAK